MYQHEQDQTSGDLARLISLLNEEESLNANVFCPFGCTKYCHRAEYAEWDLVIQHIFKKIVLPKCSKGAHHQFASMSLYYFRDPDDYGCIIYNPAWPITPAIIFSETAPNCLHVAIIVVEMTTFAYIRQGHHITT